MCVCKDIAIITFNKKLYKFYLKRFKNCTN